MNDLWVRGGFPRSFFASDDEASFRWRLDFIRTFVERDLPTLGSQVPSATTDRFWRMLAHVHGQVWNGSRIASSFGVADSTVRRYLDTLTATLVVEQLQPWHENVGKRQVKSPKVFIADLGLLHALLDLPNLTAIERHPSLGASVCDHHSRFGTGVCRSRRGSLVPVGRRHRGCLGPVGCHAW